MLLDAMAQDPFGDVADISKKVTEEAYTRAFGPGVKPAEPLMESLRKQLIQTATIQSLQVVESASFYLNNFVPRLLNDQLPGRSPDMVSYFQYAGTTLRERFLEDLQSAIHAIESNKLGRPITLFDQIEQLLGIDVGVEVIDVRDDLDLDLARLSLLEGFEKKSKEGS